MHKPLVCVYSQDFTQTQENCAQLHDCETVTFRNYDLYVFKYIYI